MNEHKTIKIHTRDFSVFTIYLFLFLLLPLLASSEESKFQVNKNDSSVAVRLSVSSLHRFKGKLEEYQTDFRYDENEKVVTRGDFSFDIADLKTGVKKRDKKMLKWADHQTHPIARFTMLSEAIEEKQRVLTGYFEMHGVKKKINVPFTFSMEGDRFEIDGNCTLDYREFSLPVIRFLFLKVKPKMKIQFHFEGQIIRK